MSSYSLWLLNLHGKRTILITKHESRRAARSKTCVATQNTVINAVIVSNHVSWETRIPPHSTRLLLELCELSL